MTDALGSGKQQADEGWDTYQERVLRNEGRLEGLEQLVRETRAADTKLIAQRADSLAKELRDTSKLERRLSEEQREADRREFRSAIAAMQVYEEAIFAKNDRRLTEGNALQHAMHEEAIRKNYEQSHVEIEALGERMRALHDMLSQQVLSWRDTDREAREIQAEEYARRLEVLNHAHERQQEFQAHAVTRELWQATEESWNRREQVTRDTVAALDKALLGMTPISTSDRANDVLNTRIQDMELRLAATSEERMSVLTEKINTLKEAVATTQGRSVGYANLYGWMVGAVGLIISIVIVVNILTSK